MRFEKSYGRYRSEMSKGLVRKLTVMKLGSSLFGRRNDRSAIIPVSLNPELR